MEKNRYGIAASRSACHYSGNQNFLFKVSITNMSEMFFRNIFFVFKIMSWNFHNLIILGFRESSKISANSDNFIFRALVTIWVQIQLVTWGVTNRDVLLLATIPYFVGQDSFNLVFIIKLFPGQADNIFFKKTGRNLKVASFN